MGRGMLGSVGEQILQDFYSESTKFLDHPKTKVRRGGASEK
jgi:hypothetical protein